MLNPLEMERYIAATARRGDLQVKWNNTGECSTNGKVIYLPALTDSTTMKQYKHLRYAVTHEVDHVLYSDFPQLQESGLNPKESLLGALWNIIEDHRIEYLGDMEYEGDRLCNNDVAADNIEDIIKKKDKLDPNAMKTLMPAMAWSENIAADYHPSMHRLKKDMDDAIPAEGKGYKAKLDAGNYHDVLRNIRQIADKKQGTKATLDLAKRIFKEVYEQDPEEEIKKAQEKAKQKKQGNGEGEGEGEEQQKGQGKGEGEQDGKPGKDGKESKSKKPVTVDYSDMLNDVHDKKGTAQRDMHINYPPNMGDEGYRPARQDEYDVRDYSATPPTGEGDRWGAQIHSALSHASAGFAHRVRTILQVRDRDRYQYGLKRGRMNQNSLHRIVCDAPGYNERVFKRKIVTDVLDCSITLLVDQSGSMSGEKFAHAAAAAAMLNDTVGNTLHIPVEIVSFSEYSKNMMYVHRTFKDKRVPTDKLVKSFSAAGSAGMGNNADGDAIMWVFDRLVVRPEKRKLLVVFSDGSPAGGGSRGEIYTYTQKVVKGIEKESPVDIVGIGIMDSNVTRIYKEHYVINRANELEKALLALIQNKLK